MAELFASLQASLAQRYTIERELGRGGMAIVYLAQDLRHHRPVAIKVLKPEIAGALGPERFLQEIEIAAGLTHPHILPLHDSGEAAGFLYYVMPYVEGESLRDRLRRERQLPPDDARHIAREVADALSYAHSRHVIHRDVKPENILLGTGHAVVTDFGIARAITAAGGERLTETGITVGTPEYMSPEQTAGEAELDGRSDIYSLGCVLYEMLVGKPPFAGKEGFVKRFTEPAPAPSSLRKDVPDWLDAVVGKALARNPEQRYSRAEELVRDLSRQPSVERPSVAIVSDAIGLSDKASGRSKQVSDSRDTEQPSIAVLPFANMSASPDNEYFSDGMTEDIINALSRIPTLKVAARTSTFSLKGKSLGVAEIGQLLNVKTILEGSVRRMDQRVRISAQLINTSDGYQIWSERYDRDLEDVFKIQDEIARNIVDQLKLKLTPAEHQALGQRHTDNVEAYELYLRGRHCWHRWNVKGALDKAIRHYEAALAKDPDYALAYSGLADAYNVPGLWGILPASEVLSKALAAATRAVELAPDLAESRTSLGFVQLLNWNWEAAESSFLHAIDSNPRYALAHTFLGWLLSSVG